MGELLFVKCLLPSNKYVVEMCGICIITACDEPWSRWALSIYYPEYDMNRHFDGIYNNVCAMEVKTNCHNMSDNTLLQ